MKDRKIADRDMAAAAARGMQIFDDQGSVNVASDDQDFIDACEVQQSFHSEIERIADDGRCYQCEGIGCPACDQTGGY